MKLSVYTVVAVVGVLVVVAAVIVGWIRCNPASLTLGDGDETVDSCVACHTDKQLLKEVATPEVEEANSAETSGEG